MNLPPFTGHAIAQLDEAQTRRLFRQWAEAHPNFVQAGVRLAIKIEGPPAAEALR